MKIAVLRELSSKELNDLATQTGHEYIDYSKNIPSADTIANYEIILGWHDIIAEALTLNHKIKWIQLWMVGVDNLPFDLLQQANVTVTTAKGANAKTLAQQTIGYLLMFARELHTSRDQQNKSEWFIPTDLTELTGKTSLTVGTGEIGQAFGQLAKAFEMSVDGINRSGHSASHIDQCFSIEQLDSIIGNYDYVINNLPYTAATDKLFSEKQFKAMANHAIFVNMGRGKSVDEQALIEAIRYNEIKAAALDVFEKEPLPSDSPLWTMENVIITPHRGGISDFYTPRIVEFYLENLNQFENNQIPSVNRLDYQKG